MKKRVESSCVEDTWAAAAELAGELRPGDVVCLEGDLGAGKTTFMQGLAAACGAQGLVSSPTFCIAVEHPANGFLLVHADLYRLHGPDEVLDAGWEEYLARGAVMCVEWPERAGDLIPADAKRVRFSFGDGEDSRVLEFS